VSDGDEKLEAFHFSPEFRVNVDPEFPGDGDWGCAVFGFDRDGRLQESFDSRWGAPTVVEVMPVEGERWIGQFAAGGLGGVSGVYATPSPRQLCVVTDGLAYLVDVDRAHLGARVVHDQVGQIEAVVDPGLLLLVRFIDIVAVGPDGVAWRSLRLALDDLHVVSTTGGLIWCSLDNLGWSPTIALDAATGEQRDGTRLDSIWPPDALA
jgi:hypothetical protein